MEGYSPWGHRVGHDGATNTLTCETVSLQTEETVSVAPRQWTVLEGETALTLEPDLGVGASCTTVSETQIPHL